MQIIPFFCKRGFALSLVLKVRIFGTGKWPFDISSPIFLFISLLFFFFPLSFYMAHPSIMIPSVVGSRVRVIFFPERIYEFRKIRNHLVMTTSFRRNWNTPIRLTQCCTQFKSPGIKILCVLYLHYNVAFTFK